MIWFTGLFLNILLPDNISRIFPGIFIDKVYSLVCHQNADKSFFISGEKLEVCARCTGIYTGGLIFSIIAIMMPGIRSGSKNLLLLSMIPIALDVFLYWVGIYDYSKWIAFSTGFVLGSVSILYIFKGIEEYFSELRMDSNV